MITSALDPSQSTSLHLARRVEQKPTSLGPPWKVIGSAIRHPAILAPSINIVVYNLSKFHRGVQSHERVIRAKLGMFELSILEKGT